MDRIECRRGEESLDRAAWLRAYREARRLASRTPRAAAARGSPEAAACLRAREMAAARELERLDYRPRTGGLRPRVDWLGFAA